MSKTNLPQMNRIVMSGRITKDPEMKYIQNGNGVIRLTIANDRSVKVGDKWESNAQFFDVVLWDKLAEKVAKNGKKGSPVIVEGRLDKSSYTDTNGVVHQKVEIIAEKLHILERSDTAPQDEPAPF